MLVPPIVPCPPAVGFPTSFQPHGVLCTLSLAFLAHVCSHASLFGAHSYAIVVGVTRDAELALHCSRKCLWHSDLQEESMLRWHEAAKLQRMASIMGVGVS